MHSGIYYYTILIHIESSLCKIYSIYSSEGKKLALKLKEKLSQLGISSSLLIDIYEFPNILFG